MTRREVVQVDSIVVKGRISLKRELYVLVRRGGRVVAVHRIELLRRKLVEVGALELHLISFKQCLSSGLADHTCFLQLTQNSFLLSQVKNVGQVIRHVRSGVPKHLLHSGDQVFASERFGPMRVLVSL